MSSAYFMDVAPQYRDNGCPSQCMGMNEYSTVNNMYSFETDPRTALLSANPSNPQGDMSQPALPVQPAVEPNFANLVPQAFGIQDPNINYKERYGSESVPTGLVYPVTGSIKSTRFAAPSMPGRCPEGSGNCPGSAQLTTGYGYIPKTVTGFANDKLVLGPNRPVEMYPAHRR